MKRIVVLTTSVVMLSACAAGPSAEQSIGRVADRAAVSAVNEGNVEGVVVVIAHDGEIVHEQGYGLVNAEANQAMSANAVLDYFSIGKSVTAAILLLAAERGALSLDASARSYLPEADFEGVDVTTRQLLSHTSGLWEAEHDENELPAHFRAPPPEGGILAWANQGVRLAAPQSTWMYSNGGFLFAGEIAERVSGRTLEQLIDEEMASPLGLENFAGCTRMADRRAPAYFLEAGEVRRIADVDPEWFGGAGTVCGTAGDLMRWWLALRAGRVVGASSLAEMFRPSPLERNGATAAFGYGLGVRLGQYQGGHKIGHTGSGSGGTAVLADYPEADLVILVLTNTAGEDVRDARAIEIEIASSVLGRNEREGDSPLSAALLRGAPGLYRSPAGLFCVVAQDGGLWRSFGHDQPEQLRHRGEGRFVGEGEAEEGVEYFLGVEDAGAQWFAYDAYGFPDDLAVRIGDSCGE
jgi:CubicO group peptidase (beta-lactamase class C family)